MPAPSDKADKVFWYVMWCLLAIVPACATMFGGVYLMNIYDIPPEAGEPVAMSTVLMFFMFLAIGKKYIHPKIKEIDA